MRARECVHVRTKERWRDQRNELKKKKLGKYRKKKKRKLSHQTSVFFFPLFVLPSPIRVSLDHLISGKPDGFNSFLGGWRSLQDWKQCSLPLTVPDGAGLVMGKGPGP